jgi:hypothetical protein
MNTRHIGISCVLALLCVSNAWGASVHNPIDLGISDYDDLSVINIKVKDSLLASVASGILYKGPKYNLQSFDGKIAFGNGKCFIDHLEEIKRHEQHVGEISAPLSSAVILFGSAIVGLVVVGRRIPDTSQDDTIA